MDYYVYILRTSGNTLYTGQTTDLAKRILEHQTKSPRSAKYLRRFKAIKLVYFEKLEDKSTALKREAKLKSLSKLEKELIVSSWIQQGS